MRFLWAGFLLLLLSASGALAQVRGSVESLGYAGYYRPDTWVPLRLSLDSVSDKPLEVQVQVHQQDLDKDAAVYTRTVTLDANRARQSAWVYFLPQPTDGGLPEAGTATAGPRLGDVLKVHVYDKAGRTLLATLDLPQGGAADRAPVVAHDVTPAAAKREGKLVLVVRKSASVRWQEYQDVQGLTEDVTFIEVPPEELPDHALGYAAVDAVLWADAPWVATGGVGGFADREKEFAALREWVRKGGTLAVLNPQVPGQLDPLFNADMLPVAGANPAEPNRVRSRITKSLRHIASIAADGPGNLFGNAWTNLELLGEPYPVADAEPRPDAMVDAWVTLPADGDLPERKAPFIARRAYGMGAVAWVAQDLSARRLQSAPKLRPPPPTTTPSTAPAAPAATAGGEPTAGWPRVWDRVFGWRNQPRARAEVSVLPESAQGQYASSSDFPIDLGAAVFAGVEHTGRSTAYVFVAVIFFVGYWVVAGPVAYLVLAAKKKKGLNWTVFGATSLVATLLTVVVVKVLLGGGTEARHVSVVRLTPADPAADGSPRFHADVSSRLGLYIPKDGTQRVSVAPAGDGRVAYVAPYAVHRRWVRDDAGFTDTARYVIDTDAILAGKADGGHAVDFFLRSTLKKVQAEWSGTVAEGITGSAETIPEQRAKPGVIDRRLTAQGSGQPALLAGQLTNRTGRKLVHVVFVFSHGWQDTNAPTASDRNPVKDQVLYVPEWDNGATLDLSAQYASAAAIGVSGLGGGSPVAGQLDPVNTISWSEFLYRDLAPGRSGGPFDDRERGYDQSFPLMALIDRVGPYRRTQDREQLDRRPEPVRRGGHEFNVSQQVAAGRLVILAHATKVPTPVPVSVNGEQVGGEGVTFYEVALPLSREKFRPAPPPSTTKPATQPTTQPATTKAAGT